MPARPLLLLGILPGLLLGLPQQQPRAAAGGPSIDLSEAGDSLYQREAPAMGTTFTVYLYAPNPAQADRLFEVAAAEVARIEATFSTYRLASELSRLNARAGAAPVVTDREVVALLERALAHARRSGGAFDPTVGPLVARWRAAAREGRLPSQAELDALPVGWEHVRIDSAERTVHFVRSGLTLDLGGIAKGYALDRAAALLARHGVEGALLGLGQSSYLALGRHPGAAGWAIRVPHPARPALTLETVLLRDAGLSISGQSQRYVEVGGQRYGHILDPRTGRPAEGARLTVVVAPTAETADALSTAAFVLGDAAASDLVAAVPGALLWRHPASPRHRPPSSLIPQEAPR